MPPRRLTPAQQVALNEVKAANRVYRERKAQAEAEAKLRAEREIEESEHERAKAVRRAFELGVPKSRMYTMDVMGTTNPWAVEKCLEETAEFAQDVRDTATFRWRGKAGTTIEVLYHNYPTTNPDEAYPAVLAGIIQRSDRGNGWDVIEDESDQATEFGVLPGYLHWEIERPLEENHLVNRINEWTEAHS